MIGVHIIYSSWGTIAFSLLDILIATSLPPLTCTINAPVIPHLSSTHNANIEDNTSTIYLIHIYVYIVSNWISTHLRL